MIGAAAVLVAPAPAEVARNMVAAVRNIIVLMRRRTVCGDVLYESEN